MVAPQPIQSRLPPDRRLRDDLLAASRELRETHVSWVFLDDEHAIKVKKPVDLGFLDFTTLEKRHAMCLAEVRLNRRLTPDVYLGVERITRDADGRHRLGGEGDVVDWAVLMRRLPDAQRADVLLAEGDLGRDHVAFAARRLATFHAACRADDETARFGQPEAIARNVRENLDQSRAAIGRFVSPAQAAELERAQLGFIEENRLLLLERCRAGRVRDGHGDLRLEHLYFDGDVRGAALDPLFDRAQLRVLDCIEFNDRFRYGDVAADLAFLAMDLTHKGRADLAEQLVAQYARESGDFDLYPLIDFYEGYRAYVRAKIAALMATAPGASLDDTERALAEARRYFLLALASARRSPLPPFVLAFGGLLGSGKSTLADELSASLAAPVVSTDLTRKQLLSAPPTTRLYGGAWSGAYDPAFTQRVYAEVERRAGLALDAGRAVILDASFRSRSSRQRARELAERHHVAFRFVECRAPEEVCRSRLRARDQARTISDGRVELYDEFARSFEPVDELAPEHHIVVDTTTPLARSAAAIRQLLPAWPTDLTG
jgi:aminoglycoside phosphotransferase family enzyme/predicted kinase